MGSIGVGTGRIQGSQIASMLTKGQTKDGRGLVSFGRDMPIPDRVTIDRDSVTKKGAVGVASITFYTMRKDANGKSYKSSASQEDKASFLRAVRGRSNTSNTEKAFAKAFKEAKAAGHTDAQATTLANLKARKVEQQMLKQVLADGQAKGKWKDIRIVQRRVHKAK